MVDDNKECNTDFHNTTKNIVVLCDNDVVLCKSNPHETNKMRFSNDVMCFSSNIKMIPLF